MIVVTKGSRDRNVFLNISHIFNYLGFRLLLSKFGRLKNHTVHTKLFMWLLALLQFTWASVTFESAFTGVSQKYKKRNIKNVLKDTS